VRERFHVGYDAISHHSSSGGEMNDVMDIIIMASGFEKEKKKSSMYCVYPPEVTGRGLM
jgi:hypothetical protein